MSTGTAVAVVGLDCRFPGAPDAESFWRMLVEGREGLVRFDRSELLDRGVDPSLLSRPGYVPVGALIEGQDLFDPDLFGMTEAEGALADPQQRLFLECCWRALESSGHGGGAGAGTVGVYAGAAHSSYLMANLHDRYDPTGGGADPVGSLQTAMATVADYLPLQVAYRLGLTGPAIALTTTCSTSLVAVHVAAQALLNGECDTALAGGVSLTIPQGHGYLHVPDAMFSADGRVRPFSAEGSGIVFSQGVGAVVLRRLDDALADGDEVLAVLLGSAVNNDGAGKVGFTAPSVRGQASVIAEALSVAGLGPREIGYVEAHGTATRLGDAVEVAALRKVFGPAGPAWCALGSVKGNIGHANSAAGIAGFVKAVLAVRHGAIPASLGAEPINPELELEGSPFEVAVATRPWEGPRYAGVSAFGIGGTNCHAILGEAPPRPPAPADDRPQLLLVSARSAPALTRAAEELADSEPTGNLADAAYTLHAGRRPFAHRLAAAVTGPADVPDALRGAARATVPATVPRIVFAFPGGGAQYAGMGAGLYGDEPVFAESVDRCAEALAPLLDTDVRELILARRDDPAARAAARDPGIGLPALFTVSVATAALLESWGVVPDAVLGHSLGEYAAAVVSGALSMEDAASLVAVRSTGMAAAAGAMLAVPLPEETVAELLGRHPDLDLAVVNAPDSCVLSGPAGAVERLDEELRAEGVDATRLQLDAAAHSRLIEPVMPALRRAADRLTPRRSRLPLVTTLTGGWAGDALSDPEHWVRHLRSTVRFSEAVRTAVGDAATVLVQVGPGSGLVTAARRHGLPALRAALPTFPAPGEDQPDRVAALSAAGQLWTHGVPIDAAALHRPGRRRVPLPGHPFQRRRLWIDPSVPRSEAAPDDREPLQIPAWNRAVPAPAPLLSGERWLVVGGSPALVDALARAGAEPVDFPAPSCTGAIYVHDRREHREHLDGRVRDAVMGFARFAALLASHPDPPRRLLLVTAGGERVESTDALDPAAAAIRALPRVLAQESPGLTWRSVDFPLGAVDVRAVVAEVADLAAAGTSPSGGAAEIAVRAGTRWLRSFAPWRPAETPVKPESVAVILGGLGDVGFTMAEHLAGQGARVVLTSRTGVPEEVTPGSRDAERLAWLRRLAGLGLEVEIAVVDAADPAATRALLDGLATRYGRLDLVIHGAGVVASAGIAPLREADAGTAEAHARAKVGAAVALRGAIDALPERSRPRTVVLMSSATAAVGGLGLGLYAAANRALDAIAEQAFRPAETGTRWISVAWDGWRVGPAGQERTVASAHSIGAADGMRALDRILAAVAAGSAPPVVAVSPADLAARLTFDGSSRGPRNSPEPSPAGERDGRRQGERLIAGLWSELLGFPVDDREADFFALGGHSLLATRMLARLADDHGVTLRLSDLLARPTVAALAELLPDGGSRREPAGSTRTGEVDFPLTRVQHAYWVGGGGGYRHGGTACHFYLEYDCPDLDIPRYQRAWNRVIARHPMLRAVITPEGRNRVLDRVPTYRIRVHDLRAEPDPAARMAALREQLSHRTPRPDRWPLVELRAALLPGGTVRLFVGVDVLVCDTASYLLLDRELRHFYEHDGGADLPPIGTDFGACVRAMEERRTGPAGQQAATYWRARLDDLPGPPALPVRDGDADTPRFARRSATLPAEAWERLKRQAAAHAVTPTAVLLAAYGDALHAWSGSDRFCVNLTLFDRPRIHPDVGKVVGDFTSLLLHETDRRTPATFAERARAAQRRLFEDLDHRDFSALDVLAELSARTGRLAQAPVVFTSALGLDDAHDLDWVGTPVYGVSQTPQVWLDHQAFVQHGELLLQWDVAETALPAEEADAAFERYVTDVRRLADDPAAWDDAYGDLTLLLREGKDPRPLFLVHPSGGDVLCYAELARLLATDRPVVGLTDPAFAGIRPPGDMEALADLYVRAVRAWQPSGPYALGGWSMGGTLAQLMACRLAEAGEKVELLAMLDSNVPDRIRPLPAERRDAHAAARYLRSLEAFLDADLDASPADLVERLAARPAADLPDTVSGLLRRAGLMGARDSAAERLEVFTRHLRILGEHRARRLDADTRVLLIRAARPAPLNGGVGMGVDDVPGHDDLGWSPFLTRLHVEQVDAHHYSLLRPPAVRRVAELLGELLHEL
ncbi:type I polyketide synthase [Nonomuraea jabiensis]|uniref:Acyl transferase domain-containing protein/thioesterase domain-containing protein n=1 Tax=Nonomuraea jabiensis TaxID=882448 RepID=A0A7W9GD71_9ACTN|nr:type I polyketide synthase [Nonomuraea jabiensis]MBB5781614.1 acyl transferase domain-containing protein/thioesterase domain-containing protein [Nonomuraea jabiensis]